MSFAKVRPTAGRREYSYSKQATLALLRAFLPDPRSLRAGVCAGADYARDLLSTH